MPLRLAVAAIRCDATSKYRQKSRGNLHYNVQVPEGEDGKAFLRDKEALVNHLVYEAVDAFGGSFSAEHGVGALKTDKLEKYQSPVALQMMRAIKQALDPQGLMNPGVVLTRG